MKSLDLLSIMPEFGISRRSKQHGFFATVSDGRAMRNLVGRRVLQGA
jgi:hypothetical protein